LRQFLGDLRAIQQNLRDVIATADVRLTVLLKALELRLVVTSPHPS
jgi:hypothetical protein